MDRGFGAASFGTAPFGAPPPRDIDLELTAMRPRELDGKVALRDLETVASLGDVRVAAWI